MFASDDVVVAEADGELKTVCNWLVDLKLTGPTKAKLFFPF